MTDHTVRESSSTRAFEHVTAALAGHRRLVDAMVRCNDIVARAGRDCLERQAAVAGSVLCGLLSAGPATARAVTSGDWSRAGERMFSLVQEVGTQLAEIQRRLFEAQFALVREVADALVGEPPAPEAAPRAAAEPATAAHESPTATEGEVESARTPPAEPLPTTAELAPAEGEAAKSRRGRRTVAG